MFLGPEPATTLYGDPVFKILRMSVSHVLDPGLGYDILGESQVDKRSSARALEDIPIKGCLFDHGSVKRVSRGPALLVIRVTLDES